MSNNDKANIVMPTSYSNIRGYSNAFKNLVKTGQPLQINLSSIPLVTKIDITDPNFQKMLVNNKLAIVPGLESGNNLVLCVLGLDSWGNILQDHIRGRLEGEETWPDAQLIKFSQIEANPDDPQNVYHRFLP